MLLFSIPCQGAPPCLCVCMHLCEFADTKQKLESQFYFLYPFSFVNLFLSLPSPHPFPDGLYSLKKEGVSITYVHLLLDYTLFFFFFFLASRCRTQVLGTQASVAAALRLNSCGTWAWLLQGMWNLPRPGIKPVSPTLAGGFLSTAPSRKSLIVNLTKTT